MEYTPKNCNVEELKYAVLKSKNYSEVLRLLQKRTGGDNALILKKHISYYNIDISHFHTAEERAKNISKFAGTKAPSLESILVKNSNYSRGSLKKRLYKEGLKTPICELCGQDEYWNGKKMSLIIDHINGDSKDNTFTNLRIVCPNCNATLDTHCSKNKIKKDKPLKYIPKEIYWENRKKIIKVNNQNLINKIIESNIDFTEWGWGVKVSNYIGKTPQYSRKFVKLHIPQLWDLCKKHKN